MQGGGDKGADGHRRLQINGARNRTRMRNHHSGRFDAIDPRGTGVHRANRRRRLRKVPDRQMRLSPQRNRESQAGKGQPQRKAHRPRGRDQELRGIQTDNPQTGRAGSLPARGQVRSGDWTEATGTRGGRDGRRDQRCACTQEVRCGLLHGSRRHSGRKGSLRHRVARR